MRVRLGRQIARSRRHRTWGGGIPAAVYNDNLAQLGRIAAEVAALTILRPIRHRIAISDAGAAR